MSAVRSPIRVEWGELVRRVRRRRLDEYADAPLEIEAYDLRATPFREIVDLYLRWRRHPGWSWVDAGGRREAPVAASRAAAQLVREALLAPIVYRRHRRIVRALGRQAAQPPVPAPGGPVLYLKTDHDFGLRAGGSVAHVAGVVAALRARGSRVHVVASCRLAGIAEDHDFHCIPPVYHPVRNVHELPLLEYNRPLLVAASRLAAGVRPTFVYQRYALHSYAGPMLRRRFRLPFVCEYNGSMAWMARQWEDRTLRLERLALDIERLNLRAADLVVVPSRVLAEEVATRGVRPERILVNPNGVDPERYRPDAPGSVELRRELGLGDKLVVGFIGTFGPWHGVEVLVEAASQLLRGASGAGAASAAGTDGRAPGERPLHFLIMGDGLRMPAVRARIAELGLQAGVTLTGMVAQEAGAAHLAACDLLVSPHVANPDGSPFFGSPTKLFEYMATGRPIVASALGQIAEVLADGETALLVPPGDAAALAAAIRRLAEDAALRERLGRAARAAAIERHTWDAHARRIVQALQAALAAQGAAAPEEAVHLLATGVGA